MIYERLRTVSTADELLDQAFRRAVRSAMSGSGRVVNIQRAMIQTVSDVLSDRLLRIVHDFPNFDELSPFYSELTEIIVGTDRLRMSLSSVHWAGDMVRSLARESLQKTKHDDPVRVRKAYYARISSIVHEVDGNLRFLNDARNKLRKLPDISDVPTIVFTTKGIYIGHFTRDGTRYQVVDTPGLLDRPLGDRNEIELQAITALNHVGDVVLLLIDPSEHCGYPLTAQINMLHEIEKTLAIPVIVAANKCDLADFHGEWEYQISAETGDGMDDVMRRAIEVIDSRSRDLP